MDYRSRQRSFSGKLPPLHTVCIRWWPYTVCVCAYMLGAPCRISLTQTFMHLFFSHQGGSTTCSLISNWRSCEWWLFDSETKKKEESFQIFCQLIYCSPLSNEQLSLQYQLLGCVLNLISFPQMAPVRCAVSSWLIKPLQWWCAACCGFSICKSRFCFLV